MLLPYLWTLWRWRHVPGPLPLPLLGNIMDIMRAGGLHAFLLEASKEYGGPNKTFKVRRHTQGHTEGHTERHA